MTLVLKTYILRFFKKEFIMNAISKNTFKLSVLSITALLVACGSDDQATDQSPFALDNYTSLAVKADENESSTINDKLLGTWLIVGEKTYTNMSEEDTEVVTNSYTSNRVQLLSLAEEDGEVDIQAKCNIGNGNDNGMGDEYFGTSAPGPTYLPIQNSGRISFDLIEGNTYASNLNKADFEEDNSCLGESTPCIDAQLVFNDSYTLADLTLNKEKASDNAFTEASYKLVKISNEENAVFSSVNIAYSLESGSATLDESANVSCAGLYQYSGTYIESDFGLRVIDNEEASVATTLELNYAYFELENGAVLGSYTQIEDGIEKQLLKYSDNDVFVAFNNNYDGGNENLSSDNVSALDASIQGGVVAYNLNADDESEDAIAENTFSVSVSINLNESEAAEPQVLLEN